MRSVHIMMGMTWEAGSQAQEEWPVAAFSTKERAETFINRANAWLDRKGALTPGRYLTVAQRGELIGSNPYDSSMVILDEPKPYYRVQVFLDPPLPTKGQGA